MTEETWFDSWQEQEIFSSPLRRARLWGKTQLHMRGAHYRDKLTAVQHLVLNLRMTENVPSLPYVPSWLVGGQL